MSIRWQAQIVSTGQVPGPNYSHILHHVLHVAGLQQEFTERMKALLSAVHFASKNSTILTDTDLQEERGLYIN